MAATPELSRSIEFIEILGPGWCSFGIHRMCRMGIFVTVRSVSG